jgi:hypothetical protein
MKKQLQLLGILLILVLSMFGFAAKTFIPAAKATYVEGPITQDTIWTLVDSPFVVSKNITVYPNATLIIEPGVEVRFGSSVEFAHHFSLIVEGKLVANGTADNKIEFTSNKDAPETGDWETISFTGTQLSLLKNCIVKYGTEGITIENSQLEIQNSAVSFCQEGVVVKNSELNIQNCNVSLCTNDGLNLENSNMTAQDNVIMQNGASGINITGNNQVAIKNNKILANKEGITITGNDTSGVNISQNIIAANTEDGILFNAETHSNIVITNNTISSNNNGLHVLTLTSTYVTNNSLAYNTIGILYDQGNHTAYFNDIYGNGMGMDAGSNATINAEHNYWGDASGPYHVSLNPAGRGNKVGGDGVTIDFIFFLTKPIGYINSRPIGKLVTDKIVVPTNEEVMFFATGSTDDGHVDLYRFDFDDGRNSGWTTLSVFAHKYSSVRTYDANLTVMDDFGATSEVVTTTINVTNLSPLHTTLDLSRLSVNEGEQVSVTVYVTYGTNPVVNASVTVFPAREGDFSQASGLTDAAGYFVANITARDVSDVTNIRVIARASINGYADGSDYKYLEVLPLLSVQIVPDSSSIKSEESTTVTVNVNSNGQPVANTYLMISSDKGNLSVQTGTTDLDGVFSFNFTAPLTTQPLNSIITVNAKKDKYIDGTGYASITVEPKTLDIQIDAQPSTLLSEAKSTITVHVSYETVPIEGANVTISAVNGNLSQTTGLTNIDGLIIVVFSAPAINEQTIATIVVNASMVGYASNQNEVAITVNPKTFNIRVEVSPTTIESELLATVSVNVTCKEDGKAVSDAFIMMSADNGTFVSANKTTGQDGLCLFIFSTPQITSQVNVTLIASVSKGGFASSENQTVITVVPKASLTPEAGFPLLMVLLIVIPIVIAVVVVVLIKLKIISVSLKEEET